MVLPDPRKKAEPIMLEDPEGKNSAMPEDAVWQKIKSSAIPAIRA